MIFATRSFLSFKGIPLFLLTFRSLVRPAASQKFIDSSAATAAVADYFQAVNQMKLFQEDEDSLQYAPFTIRLHLIRHGETLANLRNVVLGQGDSPLTDNGLALAQMAAESSYINGRTELTRYWRTYCSDLYRAHRTAKIVLGLEDIHGNTKDVDQQQTTSGEEGESDINLNNINLIVDPRLREVAKGAREGYLKKLSMEEAMSRRLQEAVRDNRHQLEQKLKVPKLESVSDAWGRARDWVETLVKDAYDDYYSAKFTNENDDASCNADNNETQKVYNVFALSHSALIRTMIHKMVDSQLPKKYAVTNQGSLLLPNLSRTIIDVHPYYSKKEKSGSSGSNINGDINGDITLRWKCRLVHLADVSHLSDDPSINRKGPPYL